MIGLNTTNERDRTVTRLLNPDIEVPYPDVNALWSSIEAKLTSKEEGTATVMNGPQRNGGARKAVLLTAAAALLVATPVFAAIANDWDRFPIFNTGVRSALLQGMGQPIEQTVQREGVKLTINTAIMDDNRLTLLFSVFAPGMKSDQIARFAKVSLYSKEGEMIEGEQRVQWDSESKCWRGYFETYEHPGSLTSDVRLTAENWQVYAAAEAALPLRVTDEEDQTFTIDRDGIGSVQIRPIRQGDSILLASSVSFSRTEAKVWAFPEIGVYRGGDLVQPSSRAFGKPGENGAYTGQQTYNADELEGEVAYKLMYTRKLAETDGRWSLDLRLDKRQMLAGTIREKLDIPVISAAGAMTFKEMIVTPTQIRLVAVHERYGKLPYQKHRLEVDREAIGNYSTGIWSGTPYKSTFRYELPPGVKVTEETPITFVMRHETVEHDDAADPIRLSNISDKRQTITTNVGGYPVTWTYYTQDGDLYVASESDDPRFGGINQTYMRESEKSTIPGEPVTVNFTGDGINRAIDVYRDFKGKDADIYIYYYTTDTPDKEVRVSVR